MTSLTIWHEDTPTTALLQTTDGAAIAKAMASIGVRFERWEATARLPDGAGQDEVLAAYGAEVAKLQAEGGYTTTDVIRLARGTPDTAPMRQKFLSEHIHSEDEVRFFVEGGGAFYLRADGKIHQVICEADDLISVPAGTRHWFDMGPDPFFCAIRMFIDPSGWVADYTGDDIADRFPRLDSAA
jgi:1,2-dihydroxy-3-keto-5-methylthiopentene dioxygenase